MTAIGAMLYYQAWVSKSTKNFIHIYQSKEKRFVIYSTHWALFIEKPEKSGAKFLFQSDLPEILFAPLRKSASRVVFKIVIESCCHNRLVGVWIKLIKVSKIKENWTTIVTLVASFLLWGLLSTSVESKVRDIGYKEPHHIWSYSIVYSHIHIYKQALTPYIRLRFIRIFWMPSLFIFPTIFEFFIHKSVSKFSCQFLTLYKIGPSPFVFVQI
jgi:hypothetical protein